MRVKMKIETAFNSLDETIKRVLAFFDQERAMRLVFGEVGCDCQNIFRRK